MNRISHIIIVFLFPFSGLLAQTPIFSVSKQTLYFGEIAVGSAKKDIVVVKNAGTDTLRIFSIISTYKIFTVSPDSLSIMPNDSATITITFQPTHWGYIEKKYIVFNHNAKTSSDSITVSGIGMQAILVMTYGVRREMPLTYIDFGTIKSSTFVIDSFRVYNQGNDDLRIKAFTTNPSFSVSPQSSMVVSLWSLVNQLPIYFKVTFKPSINHGREDGYIILTHNGPSSPDSVYVFGNTTTSISDDKIVKPLEFELFQNYPNPFNPSTIISFTIPHDSYVSLIIYNTLGQEVETLVDKLITVGKYSIRFETNNLPSGVYYYKLIAGMYTQTRKFVLLR